MAKFARKYYFIGIRNMALGSHPRDNGDVLSLQSLLSISINIV